MVGPLYVNCYVVSDEGTGETVVIDPGGVSEELLEQLDGIGSDKIKYILLTHCHFDHIMGVDRVRKLTGAPVLIHRYEAQAINDPALNGLDSFGLGFSELPVANRTFDDGEKIAFGDTELRVMHTPGHSMGSCCFVGDGVIFSGDTLFRMGVGRTDLPGGDTQTLRESITRLFALEGDYQVYPGHDDKTTLNYERVNNYFMN